MIISKAQVQHLLKIYGKDPGNNRLDKASNKAVSKQDKLAISQESKLKQRLMQAVKQTEDLRIDKVNDLKEQISTGTYTVSDDEVADKMIERAIVDRLV
jgi:negative regulator of flagellin synthesis FlgM